MTTSIIHFAFVLMLVAQAIRNILLLRVVLISAQTAFVLYGPMSENLSVAAWHVVFILLNIIQVIFLLRQRRPITIPEEVIDVYEATFSEMSFLTGEPASADVLCQEEVICIAWTQSNLKNLEKLNHRLWSKMYHILSRDLVAKVKRVSSRLTEA